MSLRQHGLCPYSARGQYCQHEFKLGLRSHRGLTPRGRRLPLGSSPIPPGFSRFPIFTPRKGDLVLNVSNDEPVLDGETDNQRQQREQRNADRAQRRAEEQQRQLVPNNLDDAFDMVGDQPVFKTPSTNVAVAMVNLDRLSDTPECQGVRTSIRAQLITAMGQTVELLRRTQAISYIEVTFDQTH